MTRRFVGILSLLVIGALAWSVWPHAASVHAQDDTPPANLLVNGSLEEPYYGAGKATRAAPNGWQVWLGAGDPEAFPHTDKNQVRTGEASWNFKQGFTAFTAAGFQRVTGLTDGTALTLTGYGWLYTCNDTTNSCIIPEAPYRRSDTSANARLKVGIDPTGGTNPLADSVTWSAETAPYDRWAEMTVSAVVDGSAATVFLHMTQENGLAMNNAYWDEITLLATDDLPADGTPQAPDSVPFVVPQGVQPDGSIVHVIQAEDTLSSIAFAYVDYGVTRESIAELNEGIRPNSRWLTIGRELIILPPGSVDPTTGRMLEPGEPTLTPNPSLAQTGTPAAGTPVPTATPAGTPVASADLPDTRTDVAPLAEPIDTESMPLTADSAQPAPEAEPAAGSEPAPASEPVDTESAPLTGDAAAVPLGAEPPAEPAEDVPAAEPPADEAAPESEPAAPLTTSGLAANAGEVCVVVFHDANLDGLRGPDETLLPGVTIVIAQGTAVVEEAAFDGTADPLCVALPASEYQVRPVLPAGYGLTTGFEPAVTVFEGRRVADLVFGAAEDYTPPVIEAAPAANANVKVEAIEPGAVAPVVEVSAEEDDQSLLDQLYDYSGLIVLGLAAVVMVGSATLFVYLRRFPR